MVRARAHSRARAWTHAKAKALLSPAQVMTIATIFTLQLMLPVGVALAQSIDDCMTAEVEQAIQICRTILQKGSRNADVYWKLSSALHQDNQTDEAKELLRKALSLHPSNSKLETLNDLISSDASEQAQLEESRKKNQSSLNKGALKIACRTRESIEGMNACIEYLELTDEDADRIQARLSELERLFKPNAIGNMPAPPVGELPDIKKAERPEQVPDPKPLPAAIVEQPFDDTDARQRELVYRQIVLDIQNGLNDLDFDAGGADGDPGPRTQEALRTFNRRSGATTAVASFDTNTVQRLRDARAQLNKAQSLLNESNQAARVGDNDLALARLNLAESTSPLIRVPLGYRESLASTDDDPTEIPPPSTTNKIPERDGDTQTLDSKEFDQLMAQIRQIRNSLAEQQSDRDARMNSLRHLVNEALH